MAKPTKGRKEQPASRKQPKRKKKKDAPACDKRERNLQLTLFRLKSKTYNTPAKLKNKLMQDIHDKVLAERKRLNLVQCKDSKCKGNGSCFQGYHLANDIQCFRTKIAGGWTIVCRYSGKVTHFCM